MPGSLSELTVSPSERRLRARVVWLELAHLLEVDKVMATVGVAAEDWER